MEVLILLDPRRAYNMKLRLSKPFSDTGASRTKTFAKQRARPPPTRQTTEQSTHARLEKQSLVHNPSTGHGGEAQSGDPPCGQITWDKVFSRLKENKMGRAGLP